MAIETKIIITNNLFVDNESIIFDRKAAEKYVPLVPELKCLTIIAIQKELPRDIYKMLDECAKIAIPHVFLQNSTFQSQQKSVSLILAHDPWQPKNSVVRHKKLWKSLSHKWELLNLELGKEVCLESEKGLRYAGVIKLSQSNFRWALHLLNTEKNSFIISMVNANSITDDFLLSLASAAFLEDKTQLGVNWLSLSLLHCSAGNSIIRTSGSYDERMMAVDIISLREDG